ncbi:C2 domain-containing protein [Streptomyces sp. NPDC051546]|uniref:C2 domain-containing protein n=1 Tax=Streptomyces sp. NPDC051546 TaxID=3365655 RepID=UPI00378F83A2
MTRYNTRRVHRALARSRAPLAGPERGREPGGVAGRAAGARSAIGAPRLTPTARTRPRRARFRLQEDSINTPTLSRRFAGASAVAALSAALVFTQAAPASAATGTLQVTVVEGRNLNSLILVGIPDAYAEVYVTNDYKQRTATVSNSSAPVWNEAFTIPADTAANTTLRLRVRDDSVLAGTEIGARNVNLAAVYAGTAFDGWVPVNTLGLLGDGEVRLQIAFQPS